MTPGTIVTTPASPFDASSCRRARLLWTDGRIARVQFWHGYPATFYLADLRAA